MSEKICTKCGSIGRPKLHTNGSIFIELFLWLFFILPGVIYSLWRHMSRAKVCRACGSADIVPVDSPLGRKVVESIPPAASRMDTRAAVEKTISTNNVNGVDNDVDVSVFRIPA